MEESVEVDCGRVSVRGGTDNITGIVLRVL